MGVVPYNFEPEYTEEELERQRQEEAAAGGVEQAAMALEDWCFCQECEEMATENECVCCRSADYVLPNIGDLECITEHEQFTVNSQP